MNLPALMDQSFFEYSDYTHSLFYLAQADYTDDMSALLDYLETLNPVQVNTLRDDGGFTVTWNAENMPTDRSQIGYHYFVHQFKDI